jgi:hypothetical protein
LISPAHLQTYLPATYFFSLKGGEKAVPLRQSRYISPLVYLIQLKKNGKDLEKNALVGRKKRRNDRSHEKPDNLKIQASQLHGRDKPHS